MIRHRFLQQDHCFGQSSGIEQGDAEAVLVVSLFEMGNRFDGISLGQQRVAQQPVAAFNIWVELECIFQGWNGGGVLAFLNVHSAKIDEGQSQFRIEIDRFLEFGQSRIELAIFVRLDAGVEVFGCRRSSGLKQERERQQRGSHYFTGSLISRN